jgi:hypothetical protein
MRRRSFLSAAGVATVVGTAGCLGGTEVVTNVQRTVTVEPGQGWIEEVPDVSENGGGIQYTVNASQPFDVYFFTSEEDYMFYDTYTDGGKPARTPSGHDGVGTAAEKRNKDAYQAATGESGGRKSIGTSGPYFFVVDHSGYRDENQPPPDSEAKRLSAFVDLTVTKKEFGL